MFGFEMFTMMNFFHTSMRYWVPQWKTFGDLKFEKYCLLLEATLDFDYRLKISGTEAINLGFFIKINNFMTKMADLSQKTIMITKKIPPKIVKIDLHSNQSK